jgi:CDP-diacylglycerol--glycerol-3-phosphate 3-phosphatidyltransferase
VRTPADAAAAGGEATDGPVPAAVPERPAAPEAAPPRQARLLNIANILTIMRLVLVPVFVVFVFVGPHVDAWRIAAFAAYAVAAVTDQIDGAVARRLGLVTDFGAFVDPVADKALTGAALVSLSILGEISWVVTAVVILREVGVTLLRLWVIRHGVIAASRGGKLKTLLLNIALGLAVLPLTGVAATVSQAVLIAGVVVAVATGVDYVARALRLRRTPKAGAAARPADRAPGTANGPKEAAGGVGWDIPAGRDADAG